MSPSASVPRWRLLVLAGGVFIGVFALVIGALLLVRAQMIGGGMPTAVPISNGVTPLAAPRAVADFTLPGKDGAPLALADLRGAYTVLFFGYTHCPDFCPLTLNEFRQVRRLLGDSGDQVQVLFISVDGARDTPALLERYVNRFDPSFLAMQGDDVTLAQISPDYGLFYERQPVDPVSGNYAVDHSTPSYLIDPEGRLVAIFSFSAEPDDIAAFIADRLAA